MRAPGLAVAMLVALACACPAIASGAGPDPVGPPSQSLADGCQRNVLGMLSETSPEWVYVHSYDSQFQAPDNTYQVEGVAHDSHPSEDDLPEGHKWFDLNTNVAVDPQYQDLIAGDPTAQTGNYAPGDEQGFLHVEWEHTGTVPAWAWPTETDRLKLWGSWIWDCGHWGLGFPDYFLPSQVTGSTPNSGPITGERTEFHPMKFMVVTRAKSFAAPDGATQTDVFASTDGTKAHAEEQCAHDHPAPPGSPVYGPDYTACIQDPQSQQQTLSDRDYSFFVPAPPKPTPNATLTYRIVDMQGGNEPSETVTPAANGINVAVHFQGSSASAYGKRFFVGWTPAPRPPVHLQVTVNSVKINHSLDPNWDSPGQQTGQPPGEYNVYLDANGSWAFLNDWAPALGAVVDGQVVPVGRGEDVYVPRDDGVRILFFGRECDFPGVQPCATTAELAPDNDRPGTALDEFASVKAAIGTHTVVSDTSSSGPPPASTRSPNYEVTYTVSRVDDGG